MAGLGKDYQIKNDKVSAKLWFEKALQFKDKLTDWTVEDINENLKTLNQ
jgi:hypothetical protein